MQIVAVSLRETRPYLAERDGYLGRYSFDRKSRELAGRGHHIAATWDFPKAHLQFFVDGKLIAAEGPHDRPWPSSLVPEDKEKGPGIGIMEADRRSMPMQAFIGGDKDCNEDRSAEAVLDEFRISDVVRYAGDFVPSRQEFSVDRHTRALFHFENERHGMHDSDDRFVRGHLACELPRQEEKAPLENLPDGWTSQPGRKAVERGPSMRSLCFGRSGQATRPRCSSGQALAYRSAGKPLPCGLNRRPE